MASMTMTASLLPSTASPMRTKQSLSTPRRGGLVVAKASISFEGEKISLEAKRVEDSSNGRRELVFAAAAAAACSVAKVAMADVEPKPGTSEAKKKYAPVCVTMPTARICHK